MKNKAVVTLSDHEKSFPNQTLQNLSYTSSKIELSNSAKTWIWPNACTYAFSSKRVKVSAPRATVSLSCSSPVSRQQRIQDAHQRIFSLSRESLLSLSSKFVLHFASGGSEDGSGGNLRKDSSSQHSIDAPSLSVSAQREGGREGEIQRRQFVRWETRSL